VLCPRCHQIVPDADYCNQCGQGLSGLALHLQQLALAGDVFWVADESAVPSPTLEAAVLEPDESVDLADPELPEWLRELPAASAPADVELRVYPALQPIEEERDRTGRGTFVTVIVLFMFVIMLAIVVMSFLAFFRG
jgi:hypothetical protein